MSIPMPGRGQTKRFARLVNFQRFFADFGRETRIVLRTSANNNSNRKTSPYTDARPWTTCESCQRRQAKRGSNGRLDPNSSDRFRRFAGILSVSSVSRIRVFIKFLRGADLRALTPNDGFSKNANTHVRVNVSNRRENNNKVTNVRARAYPDNRPCLENSSIAPVSLSTGFVS